jgi:uncharacterized membrane protein
VAAGVAVAWKIETEDIDVVVARLFAGWAAIELYDANHFNFLKGNMFLVWDLLNQ